VFVDGRWLGFGYGDGLRVEEVVRPDDEAICVIVVRRVSEWNLLRVPFFDGSEEDEEVVVQVYFSPFLPLGGFVDSREYQLCGACCGRRALVEEGGDHIGVDPERLGNSCETDDTVGPRSGKLFEFVRRPAGQEVLSRGYHHVRSSSGAGGHRTGDHFCRRQLEWGVPCCTKDSQDVAPILEGSAVVKKLHLSCRSRQKELCLVFLFGDCTEEGVGVSAVRLR
jgi:hypothetical protein